MTMWFIVISLLAVIAIQFLMWRQSNVNQPAKAMPLSFSTVRGVTISSQLAYHKNHIWLRNTDESTVAIGIDDLARRITGPVKRVVLPMKGSRIHAGESCVKLVTRDREVTILAPISGEVVDINDDLAGNAGLIDNDPYGEGWLFRLRSWRLLDQEAHLIRGAQIEGWMSEAVETMLTRLHGTLGVVSQDGGYLAEDLSDPLDTHDWIQIVRKHLGTEPRLQ